MVVGARVRGTWFDLRTPSGAEPQIAPIELRCISFQQDAEFFFFAGYGYTSHIGKPYTRINVGQVARPSPSRGGVERTVASRGHR